MRGTLLLLPLMTSRTTAAFALFSTPFAAASEAMNFDAVATLFSPEGDVARR